MSADFFEKIIKKEKKHKKKKGGREITVEDVEIISVLPSSKKKENIGSFLVQVAKNHNQGESGGPSESISTLKVPENDYSGSSSDRDSRRSSRSRNSVSAEQSPRRSFNDQDQCESLPFNSEQSNPNLNFEGLSLGSNSQPMSLEESRKYDILYPLLDPSDRPSNMNPGLESGAYASNQAPYPAPNNSVDLPNLPCLPQQNNVPSMPDPTVYLCDMNYQLRELITKRLKACWNVSSPLKSVEPLIEELNQTQGREWRLDMLDNPCDVTGSRAFKGSVFSFSFDNNSKPYVLWRRETGEFGSSYKEWLW